MAKVKVTVDRNMLSIVFDQCAFDGVQMKDCLQKWCSLKSDLLVAFAEKKCAVIQCYVSNDADFRLSSNVLKSEGVEIRTRNGADGFLYSSAVCCIWNVQDLEAVASTMEFELAQLWIQIAACEFGDGNAVLGKETDPEKFFKVVEKVILGETDCIEGIECIGNVADGYELVWLNPKRADVERVCDNLKQWCEILIFELSIDDRWILP